MEVVDSSNHITGHYRALHKPRKWYQRVFYHFLDIVVENAFIMQELMAKAKNKNKNKNPPDPPRQLFHNRQKCRLCSQKTPVTCEACAVMCSQPERDHFND